MTLPPEGQYISYPLEVEYWDQHINGMILRKYSEVIRGAVLNVGCNHGAESILISRLPYVTSVCGMDINSEAIEIARNRGKPDNIAFWIENILDGQWPLYNTVVSFHTLEHMDLPEINLAIESMKNALLKNGNIVISVPFEGAYGPSVYHKTEFNLKTLRKLFNGWQIIDLYRDQRIDGHENEHDVINLVARKK